MPADVGVSPNSDEIVAHLNDLRRRHPSLVKVRRLARTDAGRPILAATVTDPQTPANDKQHVLVVGGQHGNEESGRLVALALLDWLVSKAARPTIRRQKLVVIPNVNPDAAEQDIHCLPGKTRPNLDHAPTGPTTVEGAAVEQVATQLAPEVFVDLHARGYTGFSYDMVLYPWTRPYTEDDRLFHEIARDMVAAGEKAGTPHVTHPLTWPGWGGPDCGRDSQSTTGYAYRTFKSIVMLTENAEHNEVGYPPSHRARVGLARLRALLAWGNRRHPSLYYRGYPCYLAAGMFHAGVVAVGRTAAARRKSRLAVLRQAAGFRGLRATASVEAKRKHHVVDYTGEPIRCPLGFQFRAGGRYEVGRVKFNAKMLRRSETNGYYTWQDTCSTFVVAAVAELQPGKHEVEIEFR